MVKLFAKKIILFIFFLSGVTAILNIVGNKAGSIYKDGASIICESKRNFVRSGNLIYTENNKNILFMGNSRVLSGIQPLLFDSLSGGETLSYNLALPALSIGPYYFQLRDYLENYPPPDCILLELKINTGRNLALFDHYANQGTSGWKEMYSYLLNVENKGAVLNYFFPIRMYKNYIPKYLLYSIFDHDALSKTHKHNMSIVNQMMADRGYYLIKEQALFPDLRLPEGYGIKKRERAKKGFQFDPFKDPYVKKFFNLTQERKIRVQLIQPVYRINQFLQYETVPYQFQIILEKFKNVIVAPNGWKAKFYDNSYFADLVHLNPEGAQRYTREIFSEFKQSWIIGDNK
ncbi:MAG: hypothetical protein JSV96_17785 [Candidatus Aminicenantes bacterium]|nr:MAG: hypothetical protein JSV96_17785 [Candidatus Aminicenantes bacterium]